ncbi:hypothetical protein KA082_01010 [Candidatus Woesebacteria bacterium]|nr:hypothetical protein [Candidatus Woesebacteria bacterium]
MTQDSQIQDDGVQTGEDLAQEALSGVTSMTVKTDDETSQSDNLADTLSHLQSLLERYAMELERISSEIKEKRESLKSVFENDTQLAAAQEQAQVFAQQTKARKSELQNSPVAVGVKNQIAELSEQKKEVEETISNHLLNYYSITNSKSFDTSDGDQWEFDIRAKVKTRRK